MGEHEKVDNIAIVSAAAPNVKQGEVFDQRFIYDAMRTIVIAPKIKDPRIEVLVLGAWGCGAFGCDPKVMAQLFGTLLVKERCGDLYREVHFAIPDGADQNAKIF